MGVVVKRDPVARRRVASDLAFDVVRWHVGGERLVELTQVAFFDTRPMIAMMSMSSVEEVDEHHDDLVDLLGR